MADSSSAVLPYFPYSRQSKKKSHRGCITAKMLANFLKMAGVSHVITVDIHASQMQGFFGTPIDNLYAEPLIARWIRHNVNDWPSAVVVSKNPGGTKRVTSLADSLKLNFGIVATDRRRNMSASVVFDGADGSLDIHGEEVEAERAIDSMGTHEAIPRTNGRVNGVHPLARSTRIDSVSDASGTNGTSLEDRGHEAGDEEEYTDERARDVITGRLVGGQLVDDDYPSPTLSATMASSVATLPGERPPRSVPTHDISDPLSSSIFSSSSLNAGDIEHSRGEAFEAEATSDEEDVIHDEEIEKTITLVGNVKNKTVFIVDDMIDKPGTWIAAAETVVKRGGAKQVYCIATHGLFGNDCLERLDQCDCIERIVVTNSFPIPAEKARLTRKLVVLDLSDLLAEAIRRNHHGESISQLFQQFID
ncbi:MAG: hypothetical protein M1817_000942 [Caeruleum heppii]|nr:MAG: hypothetical protein M1817_000942 [Caeruleum heppii]